MRARIEVGLLGNAMPAKERSARTADFLAQLERAEYIGDGTNWATAFSAAIAQVPADALVLYCENPDR